MPINKDIIKQLKDIVGEDYCKSDNAHLYVYAFDSSIHRKKPDVVVQPTKTAHVQKIVQLANKHKVPVVPRGAGSGLCGMAVPIDGGIVVDMQRMNAIKDMRIEDLYCVLEPGVVYNNFIAALAPYKYFIPGPASGEVATFGGMIALNASGGKAVKYGATRDYVMGMEFVTPTGDIIRAGANTVKHSSGYQFEKLITGSEGTLGIITEANIRIVPKPEKRAACVASFDDLEKAGQAVADIIAKPLIPSQLEIMSKACIAAVNKATNMGLPEVAGMLLIELDGAASVVKRDIDVVSGICKKAGAVKIESTEDEARIVQLWKARKAMIPSLSILKEHYATTMLADDMAVPPSQIPKAVAGIWEISEKYDIIIPPYGHSGDGNLHTKVLMTPSNPEHWKQAQKAVTEIYELVHKLGGTTTGEHGIGITKAPDFFKERKSMIPLMKTVKKAFDPNNIMNPHKIDQWETDWLHELRYPTDPKRKLEGHLAKWEEQMMMCTMCGYCKNVCPTFVSQMWDPPSSRGRVIMSYGILEGELEADDSVVKALYQCTLCRDCHRRCPSKVKVPDIVRAARADLVEKGLAYEAHKAFIDNIKKTGNIFADTEVMAPLQDGEMPVFVGCQFLARPNKTKMYLKLFEKLGIKPKVVKEVCCGYPMEALGFVKDFEAHKEKFRELFPFDKAITLCPTCTVYLKEAYDIDAKHAMQVIAESLPKAALKKMEGKVTYHDPCDLSRGAKITSEPREVIKQLGLELVEMKFKDNTSRCCGGGGGVLVSDKPLSDQMAEKRITEAINTGVDTIVTACATCEQVLMNAAQAYADKKGNGKVKVMGLQQMVWKALK
ncbi:MAG: FAD-binding protein [candidate division WOR-3 bacterium]|nr:MAG: FAD-binding protein [candidate division WOR-3 bacterium]